MSKTEDPIFFETPAHFRKWLGQNHRSCSEQWVGFHRKGSGRPSITWPESVDEALCFGWIDGRRKGIDGSSYKIRFTPRRSISTWSAINSRRMKQLIRAGRVASAGLEAFSRRTAKRTAIYSYENRAAAALPGSATTVFRRQATAWSWFMNQPPSYRQTAIWWVVNAKRPETQEKRLKILIADSASGRRIAPLRKQNS
jgi:uncharacterized protein YdeI (YjbR/CyaY-like superfamily)